MDSAKPYKPANKALTAQVEKALVTNGPMPDGIRLDFSSATPIQVPNPSYTPETATDSSDSLERTHRSDDDPPAGSGTDQT